MGSRAFLVGKRITWHAGRLPQATILMGPSLQPEAGAFRCLAATEWTAAHCCDPSSPKRRRVTGGATADQPASRTCGASSPWLVVAGRCEPSPVAAGSRAARSDGRPMLRLGCRRAEPPLRGRRYCRQAHGFIFFASRITGANVLLCTSLTSRWRCSSLKGCFRLLRPGGVGTHRPSPGK